MNKASSGDTARNPSALEVHLPDEATLADKLADDLAGRLRQAIDARGRALLCVSGGRSPIPLFDALGTRRLDWSRVTVSLVDERCVPLDHADSNAGLVHRHLLVSEAAAAQFIGLVDADLPADFDADQQAANAAQRLRPLWPADAIVLGMGLDGHTASIFPGASNFATLTSMTNDALFASVVPPEAPHKRVTLTLRALFEAHHRVLQIGGADKTAVYRQARDSVDPRRPVSLVLAGAPLAVWIADA